MTAVPSLGDPKQIRLRAMALCEPDPPGLDDEARIAFLSRKQTSAAVERMYGYLDLLDRKASSIVTINSFLLAISAALLFKPIGLLEKVDVWRRMMLGCGILAIVCSGFVIFRALFVFHIKWGFMHHAEHRSDGTIGFSDELDKLCEAAVERTAAIKWIRGLTLAALSAIAIGTVGTYIKML